MKVSLKQKEVVEETTPYEMYYEYSEAVKSIPSHRILAINRGEKEKVLSVKISCDMDKIIEYLKAQTLKNNITDEFIEKSVEDSLKRLIYPSIEKEKFVQSLQDKGENGAIDIFKANLKALLMTSPVKGKTVMGYDPGFRTGCKVAILDETGKFLDNVTVYATASSEEKVKQSIKILKEMAIKYNVDVISLGNGTASRESEENFS